MRSASSVRVGEAFRQDLGFVRRPGTSTLFGRYYRAFHPAARRSLREVAFGTEFEATADARYSRLLTGVASLRHQTLFADGGDFRVWAEHTFERLERPFDIGASKLQVPTGDYHFGEFGASYASNKSAMVSGNIEASLSDIYVVWNETRLPGVARRVFLLKWTHMLAF